jgi:hypothetical protein
LPTYKFLNNKGTLLAITHQDNINTDLIRLNSDSKRFRMSPTATPGKVRTRAYYNSYKNTLDHIDVRKPWDAYWDLFSSFYEDGRPEKAQETNPTGGDGTVPTYSAHLPVSQKWAEHRPATGAHFELIKRNAQTIADDLYAPAALTAAAPAPVNTFSVNFTGRVQPCLTDPQGRQAGVNYATGLPVNTIPQARLTIGADGGSISLDNPVNGTYTIALKGIYQENYRLSVGYSDSTKTVTKDFQEFNHGIITSFTVLVASGSTDKIVVNHPPLPPTNLRANAINVNGLKTRLVWNASADTSVTAYNIYAKQIDAPFFLKIGTITGTIYDTGDPWAENATITPRVYAVTALGGDAKESFFSNLALNNDRDHDGLTDADELVFGTNPDKADTDGDGLNDGGEYKYGTNPLKQDTDGDGFSDLQEIQAGTDPLDPNSHP